MRNKIMYKRSLLISTLWERLSPTMARKRLKIEEDFSISMTRKILCLQKRTRIEVIPGRTNSKKFPSFVLPKRNENKGEMEIYVRRLRTIFVSLLLTIIISLHLQASILCLMVIEKKKKNETKQIRRTLIDQSQHTRRRNNIIRIYV